MHINEMFPARFLRGQDMTGPLLIVIRGVSTEKVRAGAGKPEETKYVLRFELAKGAAGNPAALKTTQHPPDGYGLLLRKTLANDIAEAVGTDDIEKWIAAKVVIYTATVAAAGREVITTHIRAPKVHKDETGKTAELPLTETH